MKLLIVEDEIRLAKALQKGFEQESFVVEAVHTYEDGLTYALADTYDCMIFDRMLPGNKDGLDLCKELRDEGVQTPLLLLTAMDAVSHRVDGINGGADDYLIKPFAFEELLARVQALLRRPSVTIGAVNTFGTTAVNIVERRVVQNNKQIDFSKTEFEVLSYLIHHPNQTFSKDTLINQVWGIDADILPNTVEVVMRNIRTKLGNDATYLHTVRGYGYCFRNEETPHV